MFNTQKDKLKYLREMCRKNNMTFKKDNYTYLNGQDSYKIVNRTTGDTIYSLLSVDDSYDFVMNGGQYEHKYYD